MRWHLKIPQDQYRRGDPLAIGLVALGAMLALLSSWTRQVTGAFHLEFELLLWNLSPYVLYLGVVALCQRFTYLVTGVALVAVDFVITAFQLITRQTPPDVEQFSWLPLWLMLGVLPAGLLLGALIQHRSEKTNEPSS